MKKQSTHTSSLKDSLASLNVVERSRLQLSLLVVVIAWVFFLAVFGTVIGVQYALSESNITSTLDNALQLNLSIDAPPSANRCIRFTIVGNDASTVRFLNDQAYSYDVAVRENISSKALSTGEGNFSINGSYFSVANRTLGMGVTLYAVYDRTDVRSQLLNTLYICLGAHLLTVVMVGLIAFYVSDKAMQPVADALEKQRDLTANASHELKTPLAIISTNLDVIKSEPTATVSDNDKWLSSIDTQLNRMNGLICNMLELSKLENSPLPKAILDFSDVVEGQCLAFEAVCFEKGVRLITSLQPSLKVLGEKNSLERLVLLLLDNAVKYAGDKGKVGVTLKSERKSVRLTVMNTGAAISASDAERVFERFFRTDGARSQQSEGNSYGLGLAIAKATVQNHGGTITCRGVKNKGTIFEVNLPLPSKKELKDYPSPVSPSPDQAK